MPNVYQIMFMNFKILKDEKLHHQFILKDIEDSKPLTDIFQIHYIELPKLEELLRRLGEVETLSELEFWSIMIYMGSIPEVKAKLERFTEHSEDLNMAESLLQTLSRGSAEWYRQKAYEDGERDWNSRMYGAEQKGIAIGEKRGAQQTARENARNFLKMNLLTHEQVAQGTGLSVKEVESIARELGSNL